MKACHQATALALFLAALALSGCSQPCQNCPNVSGDFKAKSGQCGLPSSTLHVTQDGATVTIYHSDILGDWSGTLLEDNTIHFKKHEVNDSVYELTGEFFPSQSPIFKGEIHTIDYDGSNPGTVTGECSGEVSW